MAHDSEEPDESGLVGPTERVLVRRFEPLQSLPWLPLGNLPTPVEPAPRLAEASGVREVWLKRDDLSADRYGGNKVRRLELLLAAAIDDGAHGVWTPGSLGSHHLLATTIFGRQLGLDVDLWHYPQPVTPRTADSIAFTCRLEAALGAELHLGRTAALPLAMLRARWRARAGRRPGHLHVLPGGGSSALGALGYVEAALELDEQLTRGEIPTPDAVVVPVGSGGTLAGLVVGFGLANLELPVIGVRVVDRIVVNRLNLRRLIRGAVRLLRRRGVSVRLGSLWRRYRIEHSQFGRGYGLETEAAAEAVDLATKAGLSLETTYSGKALAGLLGSGREWVGANGRLLFVVTANSRPLDRLVSERDLERVELPDGYRSILGR